VIQQNRYEKLNIGPDSVQHTRIIPIIRKMWCSRTTTKGRL